jgi:hypothetical protein
MMLSPAKNAGDRVELPEESNWEEDTITCTRKLAPVAREKEKLLGGNAICAVPKR